MHILVKANLVNEFTKKVASLGFFKFDKKLVSMHLG